MKKKIIILFLFFTSISLCSALEIISPSKDYKPLPKEELYFQFDKDLSDPLSLYFRLDTIKEWTLIESNIITDNYTYTCPDFFFDSIAFKVEQGNSSKVELIFADTPIVGSAYNYAEFSNDGKFFVACADESFKYEYDLVTNEAPVKHLLRSISWRAKYDINGDLTFSDYSITQGNNVATYGLVREETKSGFIEVVKLFDYMNDDEVLAGDMDIDAENNVVVVYHKDNFMYYYNAKTEFANVLVDSNQFYSVCFSADGNSIVAGTYSGDIVFFDTSIEEIEHISNAHHVENSSTPIWAVVASPDGKYIASGGGEGKIKIWDAKTFKYVKEFDHGFQVRSLQFHKTKPLLLSGSLDKSVCEWDIEAGIKNFELENGFQILAARYSTSCDSIIACGRSDSIKIWRRVKNEYYEDTLNMVCDYAGQITVENTKGRLGAHLSADISIEVDSRLIDKGFENDMSFSLVPPKHLVFLIGDDDKDTLEYQFNAPMVSRVIDKIDMILLYSDINIDTIKFVDFKLNSPEGAKYKINDGIVELVEDCYGRIGKIEFINASQTIQVVNGNQLSISTTEMVEHNKNIEIYNINGQVCFKDTFMFHKGENSMLINIDKLSNGVYFVVSSGLEITHSQMILLNK